MILLRKGKKAGKKGESFEYTFPLPYIILKEKHLHKSPLGKKLVVNKGLMNLATN